MARIDFRERQGHHKNCACKLVKDASLVFPLLFQVVGLLVSISIECSAFGAP